VAGGTFWRRVRCARDLYLPPRLSALAGFRGRAGWSLREVIAWWPCGLAYHSRRDLRRHVIAHSYLPSLDPLVVRIRQSGLLAWGMSEPAARRLCCQLACADPALVAEAKRAAFGRVLKAAHLLEPGIYCADAQMGAAATLRRLPLGYSTSLRMGCICSSLSSSWPICTLSSVSLSSVCSCEVIAISVSRRYSSERALCCLPVVARLSPDCCRQDGAL
jgi:hypothetical protein